MQRAFDRLNQQENRTQWKWTAGFAAACGVILFVALMSNSPTASNWVSDAAQAELASSSVTPPEQAPVQIAQPAKPIRTVRAE
jgi:hypothetical protein